MTGVGSTFNLALIDAYKQCPNLYDCEHPEYKVPMPTMQAWENVAQECGASQVDCRIRWKALRDRYIKERKKNILNPLNYNRKQWPLYEEMDFLKPFVEKQRRKFHNGIPEFSASRSHPSSTGKLRFSQRNLSGFFDGNEEVDCSQDSSNFNEYEDKKQDIFTNFKGLQTCEVLETPNGNAALEKFLEGIDAATPSSINLDAEGGDKQVTVRKETQAENDIPLKKCLDDFSCRPSLYRKRRFEQSRIESSKELERNHASLLGCLRASVDSLAKVSQSVLEENEEAIFGRYIAAVLSKMPEEKRNQSKLQIFNILHSADDTGNIYSAGEENENN